LSDQLAKQLDRHLFLAFDSDSAARYRLMKRGWKDFIDSDHPDTECATEMAAEAVIYLGINDWSWIDEPRLIIGVIAFLRTHYNHPPRRTLQSLAEILEDFPVSEAQLRKWFDEAFPTPF